MIKIRFTTLHPNCPNFGLVKDVGQIPYTLSTFPNIEATLVSAVIDPKGPHVDKMGSMKIQKIHAPMGNTILAGCLYLLAHAREIDWLNLYHCRKATLIWTKLYKFLNPKGKVYVKLDAGFTTLDHLQMDTNYQGTFRSLCEAADLVTVESQIMVTLLDPFAGKLLPVIPNGFVPGSNAPVFTNKQNVFLTAGRIGAPEKNNDLILEAFAKISDRCNWDLEFVGNLDAHFQSFLDNFFSRFPQLKERIHFTGAIYDRDQLMVHYQNARVFLLPSQFESFGIVVPEAMYGGCRVILSDHVTPKDDFTKNGQFGVTVPVGDIDALADAMLSEASKPLSPDESALISAFSETAYSWNKIAQKLLEMMTQ